MTQSVSGAEPMRRRIDVDLLLWLTRPNIKRLRSREDVAGLLKALQYKRSEAVRAEAMAALRELGNLAVDELVDWVKDTGLRYDVRQSALRALGELGDSRAIKPLFAVLRETSNRNSRRQIVTTISKLPASKVVDLFLKMLLEAGTFGDVIIEVVDALGDLGDPKAGPVLLQVLLKNERNLKLNSHIVVALGKLKDRAATGTLVIILKRELRYFARSYEALAEHGSRGQEEDERLVSAFATDAVDHLLLYDDIIESLRHIGSANRSPEIAGILKKVVQGDPHYVPESSRRKTAFALKTVEASLR